MIFVHKCVNLGPYLDNANALGLASIYRNLMDRGCSAMTLLLGAELIRLQKSPAALETQFLEALDKMKTLTGAQDLTDAQKLFELASQALAALLCYGNSCMRREREELDDLSVKAILYLAEGNDVSAPFMPQGPMVDLLMLSTLYLKEMSGKKALHLVKNFQEDISIRMISWLALSPEPSQGRNVAREEMARYNTR